MANWYASAHAELFQQIQQQSGAVASALVVLGLACGVYLGWDIIARRAVPYVAVGDAEDITYQTVSVSTLSGLKRCQILLDAGSLHNWMSIEAAVEMDLAIQLVSEQEISLISAIDASGNEVVPLGKVAVTWFWEGRYTPHTTVFYVGLRGAFIMILGSYYLFDNKIFTYNKKFVLPLKAAKGKKEDKAGDEAAHAAQKAKSERDMAEKDTQRRREYEEYQRRNAGGPSQGNNAQGGSGSSGTTP